MTMPPTSSALSATAAMPLTLSLPSEPLRGWIDHYKWGTLKGPLTLDVISLPSVTTELVVATQGCMDDHHPNGHVAPKPRAFVFGPMSTERGATIHLSDQSTTYIFGVTFRAGVFPVLFGEPAHEASNHINDPELLMRRARYEALLELCERPMGPVGLGSLEALLWRWIAPLDITRVDQRALRALSEIQRAPTSADIAKLARQSYVSTRHLERLFHLHFGMSPKHFACMWRFRRAAKVLTSQAEGRSLGELAPMLGFSDQAHMTREFKRFAGVSPKRYLDKRSVKLYLPPTLTEPL